MHDERRRTGCLRAEPLAAATSAVATGLQIFSPVSVALVYFAGVLSGWMLAKIAFAFFWARKHASCLRFLNKNSARYGQTVDRES